MRRSGENKEHFGEDRLVAGEGSIPWAEFFAKTPMSDQAKKDLTHLYTAKQDYDPGLSPDEKRAKLAKMSYRDFLLNVAHVSPDAIAYFNGRGYRNNMRVDTVPALVAAFRGAAGFDGLGLNFDQSFKESSYAFHFPDGGASVARLLCKKVVPRSFDGEQNPATKGTAQERLASAGISCCKRPGNRWSSKHERSWRAFSLQADSTLRPTSSASP